MIIRSRTKMILAGIFCFVFLVVGLGFWGAAVMIAQADEMNDRTASTADEKFYTVTRGDTLRRIARKTGVSVRDLMEFNNLSRGEMLYRGQELHLTPSREDADDSAVAELPVEEDESDALENRNGAEASRVEIPRVETPEAEIAEVETPEVETPEVETPQARSPGAEENSELGIPATLGPEPIDDGRYWTLVFGDEFDSESLNESNWVTCYWWDDGGCTIASNEELQWYLPGNVRVEDGALKLQAREETVTAPDGRVFHYTSGVVTTGRPEYDRTVPARFSFQYGFVEIRARVPSGPGLWSAFWLLPETHRSIPEIDVLEVLGHEPDKQYMYFHYVDADGNRKRLGESWNGPDFSAGWHTFAIDWTPEALVWYVDGVELQRIDDPEVIPSEPMYLLLNLAVGGYWPGPPDETTPFPSDYEIDYVRVWQRNMSAELSAMQSSYVYSLEPDENYGDSWRLSVDSDPEKVPYMMFDASHLAGVTLDSATLRLWTTTQSSSGSSNTQHVRLVEDVEWDEQALTYANRPPVSSETIGRLSNTDSDEIYYIPLDVAKLQSKMGTVFSLAMDMDGDDGLDFASSRDDVRQPMLIVTSPDLKSTFLMPMVVLPNSLAE